MVEFIPFEAILFLFLIVMSMVIAHLNDLWAAAMLTGISSLLAAGLFTLMDAVDVAFTEAAVGAGISTVLILGTLSLTETRERQSPKIHGRALAVVVLTGAALLYGTFDMPHYGSPEAPIHHHVANKYIEGSGPRTADKADMQHLSIPNIVTSILASYRGFDTFGETTVVLTAGLGVMLLLYCSERPMRRRKKGAKS